MRVGSRVLNVGGRDGEEEEKRIRGVEGKTRGRRKTGEEGRG